MTTILNCYRSLIADISTLSKVQLCAPDDVDMNWVLKEGPSCDKQILKYLEFGHDKPDLPYWLLPLWERFRQNDDPLLLRYLRQACCFGYKIEHEPTDEQLKAAQADFEYTEESISVYDQAFNSLAKESIVLPSARSIISRVICKCNWRQILPSHGPGSVYPSRDHVERSSFDAISSQLEEYYPFFENFCGLYSFWDKSRGVLEAVDTSERTYGARLVAVPKDSRGPRLICVHPKELIWIQQGQRAILEQAINTHCRPYISLDDQRVNGRLALESSADQEYCTLDLKEASDRLSSKLIEYLFGDAYKYLEASRARTIHLMDNRVITLKKFAPMGNCNIFPVQSLVFWAIVRAGIASTYGIQSRANVYVFGDDILFPTKYYDGAVKGLILAGLKVNMDKTFRRGFFRESCGVDAYRGVKVTPHRMKRWDITSYSDCSSICALAKNMRLDGFAEVSAYLYNRVRKELKVLPYGNNPSAQGVFEYVSMDMGTFLLRGFPYRWNDSLQRYETRILLPRARKCRPLKDDWYHLQDSLLSLERASSGRPGEVISLVDNSGYTVPFSERFVKGWTPISL